MLHFSHLKIQNSTQVIWMKNDLFLFTLLYFQYNISSDVQIK